MAIKITLYLGWGWVELGGVGLERLQFWLQKADFSLLRGDGVFFGLLPSSCKSSYLAGSPNGSRTRVSALRDLIGGFS